MLFLIYCLVKEEINELTNTVEKTPFSSGLFKKLLALTLFINKQKAQAEI
jgi:hypothetical protein